MVPLLNLKTNKVYSLGGFKGEASARGVVFEPSVPDFQTIVQAALLHIPIDGARPCNPQKWSNSFFLPNDIEAVRALSIGLSFQRILGSLGLRKQNFQQPRLVQLDPLICHHSGDLQET